MPSRLCELLERAVCALLLAALPALVGAQGEEFDSLADASAIKQLIGEERQRGNAEAAWILEHGLLGLALRNPNDVQSARILRDIGDHRLEILTQYEAGEFPPEIVLGCYYDNSRQYAEASRRGSQPLMTGGGGIAGNSTCATGSHRVAWRALAAEVQWFYAESARILVSTEAAAANEVQELLMKLLSISYRNSDYRAGRWALELLRSCQETSSASWSMQAQTLALLGDWDLLFARHFGTKYRDSAIATYERAIALIGEHGVAEDVVNSIFAPQTPVYLPAFAPNRLVSQRTDDSTGHIDITFEIGKDGKSARIRILESSVNAPRSAQRDLVNTIRYGRFRPIAADGRLVESAAVTVRYYLND